MIDDEAGDDDAQADAEEEEADEDGPVHNPIDPPATWRDFRTHLGTKYYYDPATEMVHYLSVSGRGNYVVDPIYNCTLTYDSLEDLANLLQRRGVPGYGLSADEAADAAAPGATKPAAAVEQQV